MGNPADAVQQWPIERLIPYARNARTHSEAQIEQIAASIKEFGWTVPVLCDPDGRIIAGHGRVMAATRLGIASVPVMVADGWSETQVRAYTLADNRIPMSAGWDAELLAVELDDLRDMGADLKLLGFEPGELNDLIGTPNSGPTDAPKQPTFNYQEQYGVIVMCKDEAAQQAVYEKLTAEGYQVKVVCT